MMNVYLAGFVFAVPTSVYPQYLKALPRPVRELLSFYDFCKAGPTRTKELLYMEHRCELFLDSGAFSAWSKGVTIDIDEYAKFVLDHPDAFSVVTNLDVIPRAWGEVPSQKQIDESAAKGWENYWYLAEKIKPLGLKPLHVFHQGEDVKWLKKLIGEAEYFGVSPGNDRTTKQKIAWLDEIMPLLTDDKGRAIRKFHGFGVTSFDILERYPWYSVDSTSWVLTGRFGACFVPLNGKVHKVIFSDKSPKATEEGEHFKTFSVMEQKAILTYLEQKGYTPQELAEQYQKRDELNIIFFLDLEKNWTDKVFKKAAVQPTFF